MSKKLPVLLAALLGPTLALALATLGGGEVAVAREAAAPAAEAVESVGMDVCASCHEETVTAFKRTPHAASAQGCEGCHGGGKAHVDSGGEKAKIRTFASLSVGTMIVTGSRSASAIFGAVTRRDCRARPTAKKSVISTTMPVMT